MIPVVIRKRREAAAQESKESPQAVREAPERAAGGPRRFVNGVSLLAFFGFLLLGGILLAAFGPDDRGPIPFVVCIALGIYMLFAIKIAQQWERAIVLRFGRFVAMKGPGPFMIIPVIDNVSHLIDQRVRFTDVTAESALTRDTVPVDVDAIVFWTVWDAQKCVLEVADFMNAVALSAQTALREAIGRHQLSEMITERDRLGAELSKILDEKTNPWGITVHSVEIRDVSIPQALEDAMSRQAQAERERQARIILGTAETEIAARFVTAGEEYRDHPVALHLRAMNMLYEAIKEKGSMVIVPSSAVETMGLGGLAGITALGTPKVEG